MGNADKEELGIVKGLLPVVGIGTAVVVVFAVLVQAFALGRRVNGGQYLVSVRYPLLWQDLRSFVQPDNPDVVAVCRQIGPDYWSLYDFVCRNIDYRRDVGEYWQTPSETLRGYGDCEDSSNLLTSLLRNFTNAYTVLGSYQGWGHAWVASGEGRILEATYTEARHVPDPQDYCPYVCFNDQEVVELWPGALGEIFELRREGAFSLQ